MQLRAAMPIIKDIVVGAARYGADTAELCRRAGLRPEELHEGDSWVELEPASAVWEAAVALTGDPFLGLRIGQQSNPHVVGIVGYLMESCPDIGAAIEVLCRYNPLYADMFRYRFRVLGDRFEMLYEPAPGWWDRFPETARQAVETSMTRTVAIIRHLSGRAVLPLQARFRYPPPGGQQAPYREHLKTALRFSAPENALVFDRAVLALPVASHNRGLFHQLERLAREKLAEVEESTRLSGRIRGFLLQEAFTPFPTLEEMAQRLHLSPRTLQRRLREEETTYQQVIDELRREMGLDLLRKRENSVEEIAAALGYADTSVFRRAVRRWTGRAPSDWRNRNGQIYLASSKNPDPPSLKLLRAKKTGKTGKTGKPKNRLTD